MYTVSTVRFGRCGMWHSRIVRSDLDSPSVAYAIKLTTAAEDAGMQVEEDSSLGRQIGCALG
jgi:hypothetical protein